MSAPQMTTAEALRSALASTIACSAQELQDAVGQVVVATAAELPASAAVGPADRSLFDAPTSTLVLLADRIPAGQEGQALAAEIERHHGRQAAQLVLGDRAAELLVGDGSVLTYTRLFENSRGLQLEFCELITRANFLQACNAAIDLAKVECLNQNAVAIVFYAQGVEVQVTEADSAEVQFALWERKILNLNELFALWERKTLNLNGLSAESQGKADGPKNALGQVAVKPFYIWANEDCANKSDSFLEAKAIRLALLNEGGESVHIVDADGVEVVDAEIEAHEALVKAGYFAGARKPDVKPDFPGAFMVNDPQEPEGFAIVGDDIASLILEARDHLIEPAAERELPEAQTGDAYSAGRMSKNFDDCPFISAQEVYREWSNGFVDAHSEAKVMPLAAPPYIQGRVAYRLGQSIVDGPTEGAGGVWASGWLTEKDNHDAVLRLESDTPSP